MSDSIDTAQRAGPPALNSLPPQQATASRADDMQAADIPIEEDERTHEARAFWLARGRSMVNDTNKAIDDAAKQMVTVAGVVVGFYVNAVFRGDFASQVHEWWVKFFFMLPIVVLVASIAAGLAVLAPSDMSININSSEAGRIAHRDVFQKKRFRLRFAYMTLLAGLLLLSVALLSYYLG